MFICSLRISLVKYLSDLFLGGAVLLLNFRRFLKNVFWVQILYIECYLQIFSSSLYLIFSFFQCLSQNSFTSSLSPVPLFFLLWIVSLVSYIKNSLQGVLGNPVVRTWCFHCHGSRFSPWSVNWDHISRGPDQKEKKARQKNKTVTHCQLIDMLIFLLFFKKEVYIYNTHTHTYIYTHTNTREFYSFSFYI